MAVVITQGTQTTINTIAVGGTETQVVRLDIGDGATAGAFTGTFLGGTINAGTITQVSGLNTGTVTVVGNLNAGTVTALASGTITGGTLGNLVSGTVTSVAELVKGTVTRVSNVGTVELGSVVVTSLPSGGTILNLAAGTLTRVQNVGTVELGSVVVTSLPSGGTLLNLANGTLAAVTTVTTVSNVTNGTVRMSVGTMTTGSLTDLANLYAGSVRMTVGTLTTGSLTDVAKLYTGTINAGTVQINPTPTQVGTSFVTRGTTGAAVWGTLKSAAGAGTKQYISSLSIVVASGTVDVAVANGIGGSTGDGVILRGNFPAGGGITKDFFPAAQTAANGTLAYWLGGAGTVDISVNYWQGV